MLLNKIPNDGLLDKIPNDGFVIPHKYEFESQHIVDRNGHDQDWLELLYRPLSEDYSNGVSNFFNSLTDHQKVEFDKFVVSEIPNLQKQYPNIRIGINISPVSINDTGFIKLLRRHLNQDKIDFSNLCLEIVESDSLKELSLECIVVLHEIRRRKGWIALDDFGTGHAHWELLENDLVDVIKVIYKKYDNSCFSKKLLKSILYFAKNYGIKTVIEGIETISDFNEGIGLGYKNFQGWYCS